MTFFWILGVTFRFASYYGDHMVLQKKPAGAVVWGYGEAGANVTVSLSKDSKVIMKKMAQVEEHSGTWKVVLAPTDHGGPYSVMAEQEEPKNLTLRDIYFGDVWLCSGQSNMEMTVSQIINASKELSEAPLYPYVRVFTASLIQSEVELQDLAKIDLEWSIPTAENLGHGNFSYFSAVCWLFGRHLYETLRYPIGLVESSWGGSCIESWSSGRVLQECGLTGEATPAVTSPTRGGCSSSCQFLLPTLLSGPKMPSVLWNAMIHPLLNMSLTGVIWYQGEANALVNTDLYNCTFPALIADWRRTFHAGSEGQTQSLFPFGFVQVTGSQGTDHGDRNRCSEPTADYGYAPNKRMPNTFMAVAVDLCDEHSPYGSIHPRDKQNVAYRLHLGARAVAYGEKGLVFQGPYPTKVVVDGARGLINVTYGQELLLLLMHDRIFEVRSMGLSAQEPCQWVPAPMVSASSHAVTLSSPGCRAAVTRLRYAWAEWPCEYRQCPLYNKHLLPAPPFVIDSALRTG
uniref:Sialic acid acetylesterase n=1 Tax=Chrysemys picta bellii TaxID=8478 RepID=A0A8C3FXA1_CHRPI